LGGFQGHVAGLRLVDHQEVGAVAALDDAREGLIQVGDAHPSVHQEQHQVGLGHRGLNLLADHLV
jgi:hypothetical protein